MTAKNNFISDQCLELEDSARTERANSRSTDLYAARVSAASAMVKGKNTVGGKSTLVRRDISSCVTDILKCRDRDNLI